MKITFGREVFIKSVYKGAVKPFKGSFFKTTNANSGNLTSTKSNKTVTTTADNKTISSTKNRTVNDTSNNKTVSDTKVVR